MRIMGMSVLGRKTRGATQMTRKQAILQAISLLQTNSNNKELCVKLQEIYDDMPLTHWSEKAIFDAFDQYILDYGHLPSKAELSNNKNIPTHSTVKNRFNMTLEKFFEKYYGNYIKKCNSRVYGRFDKDYWINNFKEQYVKQDCPSMSEYDKNRNKGTPMSRHLIKICGFKNWNELLFYCGFKLHGSNNNSTIVQNKQTHTIDSNCVFSNNDLTTIQKQCKLLEYELNSILLNQQHNQV